MLQTNPSILEGVKMRVARHSVSTSDGMVQQLVTLVSKGYRYYFVGKMKANANSDEFDSKMLKYYDAHLPKWTRERRRRQGTANFRYLRLDDWYIVMATEGRAETFWAEDKDRVRDVRKTPIRFKGYSISYRQGGFKRLPSDERYWRNLMWQAYREARDRGEKGEAPPPAERDMKWHVHVGLDEETYAGLKAYFLNIATHRDATFLANEFSNIWCQSYGPVRSQLRDILRAVNRARKAAGYETLPLSVIRFKRRIVKSFRDDVPETQCHAMLRAV